MMHSHAYHAIRAAKNLRNWGRWATQAYCVKHGVPARLYTLARQLEAAHAYP